MNINKKILLKEKHNNGILRLVLNDPKRKNAFIRRYDICIK